MRSAWFALVLLLAIGFVFIAGAGRVNAVNPTPTVTITSCAPSSTVIVGNTIICTVTLTGGNSPTGTVTWSTSGAGNFSPNPCTLASQSCSVNYTPTSTAPTSLTATYNGDTNNMGSASAAFPITVTKASPTLNLICSPSTVVVGLSTNCTLRVVGGVPVDGTTITFSAQEVTGKVQFPGGTSCQLSSGSCGLMVNTVGAGFVTIQATYPGDANDNAPSQPAGLSVTISQAPSTTSLICAPTVVLAGQQTTCTATVHGYSPRGIVSWSDGGVGGVFSANPCTLLSASCGITYTAKSSTTITVTYAGDGNNTGSQQQFPITVNVNEEIQITVAGSGPVTQVSLSGCSVSPTTVATDGKPYQFTASSGCAGITVSLPPPLASSRYQTASGQSSLTIGSCSQNSCALFAATIYYQLLNTYQVAPASPSSWSTGGTISLTGTVLGISGQPVCSIIVSTGAGQFSCQGWSDFNTQVTMGALQVNNNQRWATGQSSFTDIQGGNQHRSTYYSQVLEDFQYSLVGSTTAPTTPRLSYIGFGANSTFPLTGQQSLVWLDTGSSWSVPATLSGSTSSERWQGSVTSGAAAAGQTVSLTYYHQYLVEFGYNVADGGTAFSSPTVTFTSFGASQAGTQGWVDAGTEYNFTNPLVGSTALERWFTGTARGTASGAGTVSETYYHQFAVSMNFTVLGGGNYLYPKLNFTAVGAPAAAELNMTRAVVWIDSGSKWTASSLLPNSSPFERWITNQVTTGVVQTPLVGGLLYYHQYLGQLRYSISGPGGSPPVPSVNYTALSGTLLAPLAKSSAGFWMDAGSNWVVPPTMPGDRGERWLSNSSFPVLVNAAFVDDVQYTHQFYVEVGVSNPIGGQVANSNQWKDQGSNVLLNATAAKLWSFAYWHGETTASYNGTTRLASFVVSGPANETAVFFPGLFIATNNLGSVEYNYGSVNGTVAAGTNATIYPPPGRNVTLVAMPKTVTIKFAGWAGALTDSQLESWLAINAPNQLHATFQTDYPDIQIFAVASIAIVGLACFVFIVRRGFIPSVPRR